MRPVLEAAKVRSHKALTEDARVVRDAVEDDGQGRLSVGDG